MRTKYQNRFKRDTKPVLEMTCGFLNHVLLIGDILVPIFKRRLVDEIRFQDDYIAFIRDGEIERYKYKYVDVLVKYSKPFCGFGKPSIEVEFHTHKEIFQASLNSKDGQIISANFSKNQRDFLYQLAAKTRRIREKEQSHFGVILPILGIIVLLFLILSN